MSGGRGLGWVGVAGLALAAVFAGDRLAPARSGELRLLGAPFAGLASRVQWVRVHGAMLAGREDLVLQRAETAFALDPGATEGWLFLARHQFFDRASQALEPDPRRRAAWMRSALAVAERGERRAREPGQLALWLGLARERIARDEDLPWPESRAELLRRAAADFERAAADGVADAEELAGLARRLAEARERADGGG